jgi:hypothetical protein
MIEVNQTAGWPDGVTPVTEKCTSTNNLWASEVEGEMSFLRFVGLAALTIIAASLNAALADSSFDGSWATTVTCENARGGLGYAYDFVSTIKDGTLHGTHGTAGEPGYLQIDGKIEPDGSGKLRARGIIGSREYTPGRDTPRGAEYGYTIGAHFAGSSGTGKRLVGRPCTLEFEKQ